MHFLLIFGNILGSVVIELDEAAVVAGAAALAGGGASAIALGLSVPLPDFLLPLPLSGTGGPFLSFPLLSS